jgi:hypothetical protein
MKRTMSAGSACREQFDSVALLAQLTSHATAAVQSYQGIDAQIRVPRTLAVGRCLKGRPVCRLVLTCEEGRSDET